MTEPYQPSTSYVAERLRRTSRRNRQMIIDLLDLETLYLRRGGNGLHLLSRGSADRA